MIFSNGVILQEKNLKSRKLILKKDLESEVDLLARKKNVSDHAWKSISQTPIIFIEDQIWKCDVEIDI